MRQDTIAIKEEYSNIKAGGYPVLANGEFERRPLSKMRPIERKVCTGLHAL
jgi:hypothetical protein